MWIYGLDVEGGKKIVGHALEVLRHCGRLLSALGVLVFCHDFSPLGDGVSTAGAVRHNDKPHATLSIHGTLKT